jgi:GT2 family glycosyltransferase
VVSIIIINYNTFALTCNCVESIYANTKGIDFEVILVDNASDETDPRQFKERFPDLTLIKSATNTGFAGGNNIGISKAKGDMILLLNSDTHLQDDAISKAVIHFSTLQKPGVLGVQMRYPDAVIQYTARRFRSISWELFDLFRFIPMLMPYKKRAKLMLGKYFKADFNCSCDWVNGAFFLFSKTILDHFPDRKLDERFFMYGEDQLWCWQFHQLGYTNYFYSETSIIHINNASTKQQKRLQLLKIMFRHELAVMRERKGSGLYYYLFVFIYGCKEWSRFFIKSLLFRFTGKMLR